MAFDFSMPILVVDDSANYRLLTATYNLFKKPILFEG
jgi:hypothetical protein